VCFAEAQRKAEEILSSAEEEIAKLKQEHEERVQELKLATAQQKKNSLRQKLRDGSGRLNMKSVCSLSRSSFKPYRA